MKSESKFKEKVRSFLNSLPQCWYIVNDQKAVRGCPDVFVCLRGHFIAMELKKDVASSYRSSPRIKLQKHELEKISKAKGFGIMVYPENWHAVKGFLLEISEGGYYDHIDVRENTQSKLRNGLRKALKPHRLPSGYGPSGVLPVETSAKVQDGTRHSTRQDRDEVRRQGRKGEPESS